jgi:leader peptidase HopD
MDKLMPRDMIGIFMMIMAALSFFILYALLSVTLCWHDVRTGLLPDRLTCPLLWLGLLYQLCLYPAFLSNALWGVFAGYGSLALLYWGYRLIRGYEGLGYGDVKYLAALGAWHGWQRLPLLMLIACGLACAFLLGKALYRRSIADIKNPLPFGPFMGAAGFILAGISTFSLRL